jgi:hypothetical protein
MVSSAVEVLFIVIVIFVVPRGHVEKPHSHRRRCQVPEQSAQPAWLLGRRKSLWGHPSVLEPSPAPQEPEHGFLALPRTLISNNSAIFLDRGPLT